MEQHIYIVFAAIALVGLDIFVRLHHARDRRNGFYKSLLEMQAGLSARKLSPKPAPSQPDDALSHALMAYFQQSFTSRQLMSALATSVNGLPGKRLEQEVAEHVAQKWNRELSINAIRRVIMILVGANLVEVRDGKFSLTKIGWNLFLKTKNATGPRWSEASARTLVHAQ